MEFYDAYHRPKSDAEKMDPHSLTEQAGYIPANVQIEQLILAGARLDEYRKSVYDWPDGLEVDESLEDPTRAPNFDMADASQTAMAVAERLRRQAKAAGKAEKPVVEAAPAGMPAAPPIVEGRPAAGKGQIAT